MRRTLSNPPQDNHSRKKQYDMDAAEIIQAEIDYWFERITFSELFMFCQSFDKGVTVDGVINALGPRYRGE